MESTDEAAGHYKAVCRALVAEAHDLTTFLEKVHNERQVLKVLCCVCLVCVEMPLTYYLYFEVKHEKAS